MNATRMNIRQRCHFRQRIIITLAICCALVLSALSAAAGTITNVTAANVTPSSFSVFWRAPADTTPSIAVFSDPGGTTNLAGQLGIEAFPLHTGSPDLPAGYERRLGRAALQRKTQSYGLMMRVTGCRPETTYYYRVTSAAVSGGTGYSPHPVRCPLSQHLVRIRSWSTINSSSLR